MGGVEEDVGGPAGRSETHQQTKVLEPEGEEGHQVLEESYLVQAGRLHHRHVLPLPP